MLSAAPTQLVFVLFSSIGDFFSKSGLDFNVFRNRLGPMHPINKSGPPQICSVPLGPPSNMQCPFGSNTSLWVQYKYAVSLWVLYFGSFANMQCPFGSSLWVPLGPPFGSNTSVRIDGNVWFASPGFGTIHQEIVDLYLLQTTEGKHAAVVYHYWTF